MAVSLMKKQMIEFIRPGLSLSEIIDKKIGEHVTEVRFIIKIAYHLHMLSEFLI